MKTSAPKIGFDRYIQRDWAVTALKVRAGVATLDDLKGILDATDLSLEAKKKTRTVLNRLWLEPRTELVDFLDRGVAIFKAHPEVSATCLCWGAAIASYPFFGRVAELVGRLSALQGDCTSAEIHRRMSESYGEREGTRRMTNMVLQSQSSWGAIERTENGKRIVRRQQASVETDAAAWLVEAAIRYIDKSVPLPALQSSPALFPFVMTSSLAYVISQSSNLQLRSEGPSSQLVSVASSVC